MDFSLVGVISFGGSILLMFWGLAWIIQSQSFTLQNRMGPEFEEADAGVGSGRSSRRDRRRQLNRLVSQDTRARIAGELARADLQLTPGEYVAGQIATTALGLVLGYVIFRGNLFLAVVIGAFGLYVPRWYVHYRQQKRINAFNGQLPDAVVLLANSLRSGYSFLQSMETVSKEAQLPMSAEFTRVVREVGLGLSPGEALDNLAERVPSQDLNMMITAIDIQNEVGGNLAEVLDTLANTIRERVRILGEIRTITAQQRLSARILSLLPFILGLIIYALSPNYVSQLWQNQCGWMMIGTGVVLTASGYLVARRIAAIEV